MPRPLEIAAWEPPWGADGWPRPAEDGLDEGDVLLIRSWLEMTPLDRIRSLENLVNGFMDRSRPAGAATGSGRGVPPR